MQPELVFQTVDGPVDAGDITIYALSTCGFCRRAIAFLKDSGVRFSYIHVDDLPPDEKQRVKDMIRNNYGKPLQYPFLVRNGTETITGFDQREWSRFLGFS